MPAPSETSGSSVGTGVCSQELQAGEGDDLSWEKVELVFLWEPRVPTFGWGVVCVGC